jgi:hypothetical protein
MLRIFSCVYLLLLLSYLKSVSSVYFSFYFIILEGLGFELSALPLEIRHTTIWATLPIHFSVVILEMGVSCTNFLGCPPMCSPDHSLPSSKDYSHDPPAPNSSDYLPFIDCIISSFRSNFLVLYIFWTLILCRMKIWQRLSPIIQAVPSLCLLGYFLSSRCFNLIQSMLKILISWTVGFVFRKHVSTKPVSSMVSHNNFQILYSYRNYFLMSRNEVQCCITWLACEFPFSYHHKTNTSMTNKKIKNRILFPLYDLRDVLLHSF